MKLFLDMDGVLMDFEGAIAAAGVVPYADGAHWISRPRSEWPPEMIAADRKYVECMERADFWPNIEPLSDAHLLWDWARTRSPSILTATPNKTDHRDRIAQQKRESIWRHFDPTFPVEDILICLRHEKSKFARNSLVGGQDFDPNILVDDTPGNCKEWEAAGGTAILHTDAITTIRKLQELYHD